LQKINNSPATDTKVAFQHIPRVDFMQQTCYQSSITLILASIIIQQLNNTCEATHFAKQTFCGIVS